ncbi:MAG: Serine/threonine-protein kinase pkn1 [Verrucomicrobia subdivision 3 bacterium]|nr:Serine/threonine-protein kinase pkn1 [Limisphaerales bacterium]MCS1417350.1 Serine/threonine-protein kinase pkn1 [Limisphaerales bacterium]
MNANRALRLAVVGLGLVATISGTAAKFHQAKIFFQNETLLIGYELERTVGIVQLFHSTNPVAKSADWKFAKLAPGDSSLHGSFNISSYSQANDTGYFQLRTVEWKAPAAFVWIQPGGYLMGSPDTEAERFTDEGPQHHVTVDSGFWLSQYEVTQKKYQSITGFNPSRAQGLPDNPVENISWVEAMDYCRRLNQAAMNAGKLPQGYEFRLPTEEEWEYACRAGTTTAYSYGDDVEDLSEHGWYADNSGSTPSPVGSKKPNPWGLYDMHGNVFEWCYTRYKAYPGGKIRNLSIDYRAVRSGAFICPPTILRSATRFESAPAVSRSWLTGFRVALAPIIEGH